MLTSGAAEVTSSRVARRQIYSQRARAGRMLGLHSGLARLWAAKTRQARLPNSAGAAGSQDKAADHRALRKIPARFSQADKFLTAEAVLLSSRSIASTRIKFTAVA